MGEDVVVLDVSELLWICDLFLIATGRTDRRVKTLAEEVIHRLAEEGRRPLRTEGLRDARWVLLDYGDVVVHLFQPEVRGYYELERLWGDAPRIDYPAAVGEI